MHAFADPAAVMRILRVLLDNARGLAERMGGGLTALRPATGACLELRLPAWEDGNGRDPA